MEIFYLNDLDHFIKEVWKIIERELNKLKLKINPKSSITNLKTGITFLGYKYKIENKKYKILFRKKTIRKIKFEEGKFTMKAIEKYDYFKEKNPKKIVLIKEGIFYKTYKDDTKILWNLFQYKWNNSSIGFGVSNSSKVFDKFKSQCLGYVVVDSDSDFIEIKGNDFVYDSYLNISLVNYDKYEKKLKIIELLDKLIDANYADDILNYFSSLEKGELQE